MKRVKLLTSFSDGNSLGDIVELSDEVAKRYVAAGAAELVRGQSFDAPKKQRAKSGKRASSKASSREKAVKGSEARETR